MNDHDAYAWGADFSTARDRKTVSRRHPKWWQKSRSVRNGWSGFRGGPPASWQW